MKGIFRLRLLGTPQVERDGEPVRGFRSRKALALLGYLATKGHPVPRAHLAGLFWEDLDEGRGRANLSWVLHQISRLLPDCLRTDRHTVELQRTSSCWLDIDAFAALEAEGGTGALTAAVELCRAPFLDGIELDGCAEFEMWLAGEREWWRRRLADVLHELARECGQCGEYAKGLRFAQQLLALEPWRERTHCQIMRLLAKCGRRTAALAQYRTCCQILAQELGTEPSYRMKALYERIRAAGAVPCHNLAPQPTPFVGRERELGAVIGLLDEPDCRLLTLLGPGGIGKTRLALEAASARKDAFLEGVWFVPLASVSSSKLVASTIAKAIHISLSGRKDAPAELLEQLRRKEMLLILDSFEHMLNAADLLVQILQRAPEIKLLVTSRASLNLRWEWRFEVEGLEYPVDLGSDEHELETYEAVVLFRQVARRVNPRFSTASCDPQALARICQLVEGMPLGIELAAASARTHSCKDIAQHVEKNLEFLTARLQDVPARHRSVRATFDHSWRLLKPNEQETLMKLSTFRRGFQERTAREVADTSPTLLQSLVDKSLLRVLPSGRYEMHHLLRQYASEKLKARPAAYAESRDRHSTYYAALATRWESDRTEEHKSGALAAIEPELANLKAAWRWAVRESRLDESEQILRSLSHFPVLEGSAEQHR